MPYWLVYTRCLECTEESCLQCHRADRHLTLQVVKTEDKPPFALDGPCSAPQEILKRMGDFFDFDENGKMFFKQIAEEG